MNLEFAQTIILRSVTVEIPANEICLEVSLKRSELSLLSQSQTSDGRLFLTAGAELENRRAAVLVWNLGVASRYWRTSVEFVMGVQAECGRQITRCSKYIDLSVATLKVIILRTGSPVTQQIDDMMIPCPDIAENACQFVLHTR